MTKRDRVSLYVLCISLSVLVLFYGYKFVKKVYNPIINPPVATVELLEPVATLPIKNMFKPPYEYTTNVGLIRNPQAPGFLVTFHTDLSPSTKYYRTKLYAARLDEDFQALDHHQLHNLHYYKFHEKHWSHLSTAQDPRLFTVNGKIYTLYNDSVAQHHREVYLGELSVTKHNIILKNITNLVYWDGAYRDQKNWTPFVYMNDVYFIYTTDPFIILHWNQKSNIVQKAYDNGTTFAKFWNLGDIRGGTPAIYVAELDAYLSFFHSMQPYRKHEPLKRNIHQPFSRIYYTGAFLFAAKPPFKMLAYTPTPLSFKDQYKKLAVNYNIIFPCGLYEDGDSFMISSGVQDIKAEIFRIRKKDLFKQFKYLEE